MRHTKTRKRARRMHSFRRAGQRYGINFSKKREELAIQLIQNGEATFVKKSNCTSNATIWDIPYDDAVLRVVYSKRCKSIITVLSPPKNNLIKG